MSIHAAYAAPDRPPRSVPQDDPWAAWRTLGGRAACLGTVTASESKPRHTQQAAPAVAAPLPPSTPEPCTPPRLRPYAVHQRAIIYGPVPGHAPTRPSPSRPCRSPVSLTTHATSSFCQAVSSPARGRGTPARRSRAASFLHPADDQCRPRALLTVADRPAIAWRCPAPVLVQCHPRCPVQPCLPHPARCSYDPRPSRTTSLPQNPLQVVPAFCSTPPWPLDARARRSPVPVARPSPAQIRNHPGSRLRPTPFLCTAGQRASKRLAVWLSTGVCARTPYMGFETPSSPPTRSPARWALAVLSEKAGWRDS